MEQAKDVARAILAEIEKAGASFDRAEPNHEQRFLNLDRAAGEFLFFLVRATRRRRVVEIGTSNGCSTIWLAMALRELAAPGRLITIERNPQKQRAAVDNVRRASVHDYVEFLRGDATEVARTIDGPIDCIFFDADRVSAHLQLKVLWPKLSADCLLVTDNAISHPAELEAYFGLLAALPEFQTLVLPIGKGLHVAHRIASRGARTP
ncbi:class I SAM-dependent methyltransferase [Bradyrhizobium sp. BR 10289]|uniref:O-methyltransferase n=1 Tax=Bradyrhizobium sp. BR 10289 TaxID=2749993 RepID=UPI001C64DC89|nr:class I SAM-dependent methyltransferase [Bradyrhizobium sp. BR 10289]